MQVACSRPVRAILDLRPGCEGLSLATPGLRGFDTDEPPSLQVGFAPAGPGRRLLVRVDVPEHHPSGQYYGVVVDQNTGWPCGMLAVQVGV